MFSYTQYILFLYATDDAWTNTYELFSSSSSLKLLSLTPVQRLFWAFTTDPFIIAKSLLDTEWQHIYLTQNYAYKWNDIMPQCV